MWDFFSFMCFLSIHIFSLCVFCQSFFLFFKFQTPIFWNLKLQGVNQSLYLYLCLSLFLSLLNKFFINKFFYHVLFWPFIHQKKNSSFFDNMKVCGWWPLRDISMNNTQFLFLYHSTFQHSNWCSRCSSFISPSRGSWYVACSEHISLLINYFETTVNSIFILDQWNK